MSKGSVGYKRISVVMSYLLAVPFGLLMAGLFVAYCFSRPEVAMPEALQSGTGLFVVTPILFFLPRWVYMTVTWIGAGFKEDKA